jgi:hypothetical protein
MPTSLFNSNDDARSEGARRSTDYMSSSERGTVRALKIGRTRRSLPSADTLLCDICHQVSRSHLPSDYNTPLLARDVGSKINKELTSYGALAMNMIGCLGPPGAFGWSMMSYSQKIFSPSAQSPRARQPVLALSEGLNPLSLQGSGFNVQAARQLWPLKKLLSIV